MYSRKITHSIVYIIVFSEISRLPRKHVDMHVLKGHKKNGKTKLFNAKYPITLELYFERQCFLIQLRVLSDSALKHEVVSPIAAQTNNKVCRQLL